MVFGLAGKAFPQCFVRLPAWRVVVAWGMFPHNPPLARHGIPAMVPGMFELTRGEQALVAGFVFIFLLGFGVKQWRESAPIRAVPEQAP